MVSVRVLFVISSIFVLVGCISSERQQSGELYPISMHDVATLCIYRPKYRPNSHVKVPIFRNGELIGVLDDASWFRTAITSGEHVLHTKLNYRNDKKNMHIKSSFKAGEVYFVRWSKLSGDKTAIEKYFNSTGNHLLELIPREIAVAEISGLDKVAIPTVYSVKRRNN